MIDYQSTRVWARNTHILVAVYQCVYIYSPLHDWSHALTIVQWAAFPLLVLTGVWLRKGHVIWRRFSREAAPGSFA